MRPNIIVGTDPVRAMAAAVIASCTALAPVHAEPNYPLPNACSNLSASAIDALEYQIMSTAFLGYAPSSENPGHVPNTSRKVNLVADQYRNKGLEKVIVAFGDSHGIDEHVVPQVSPGVQAIFSSADLVLGNLESPLVATRKPKADGSASQLGNFHMTREYLEGFSTALGIAPGKAVFSVANNHANDKYLWKETLQSVAHFRGLGKFEFVGIDSSLPNEPAVTIVKLGPSLKVGVLGWTHVMNNPLTLNATPWLTDERVFQKYNFSTLRFEGRDFNAMKRNLGVDLMIGMPHWDCQLFSYPHEETIAQAQALMGHGMDLILGAHQSTPQPVATISPNESRDRTALTLYGMGQLYQTPSDKAPGLSLAYQIHVDAAGKLVEFDVLPMLRFKVNGVSQLRTMEEAKSYVLNPSSESSTLTAEERVVFARKYEQIVALFDLLYKAP